MTIAKMNCGKDCRVHYGSASAGGVSVVERGCVLFAPPVHKPATPPAAPEPQSNPFLLALKNLRVFFDFKREDSALQRSKMV